MIKTTAEQARIRSRSRSKICLTLNDPTQMENSFEHLKMEGVFGRSQIYRETFGDEAPRAEEEDGALVAAILP